MLKIKEINHTLWLVIALPSIAICVGILMLVVSITSYDGLVIDDYYKYGKQINRVIKRDQFAKQHKIEATMQIDSINQQLNLRLQSLSNLPFSDQVDVVFAHPTRAGKDIKLSLKRDQANIFVASKTKLPNSGRWRVLVETGSWRLQQVISLPVQTIYLKPKDRL